MKTKEEIEQLAERIYFIDGYTQCQQDMADKKYTEEDIREAIDMARKLQGITAEELKTTAGQQSLASSLNSILSEKAKISAKIEYLQQRSLTATQAELPFINKALQQLQEVEHTIDATVSPVKALQDNFEELEKRSEKKKNTNKKM